jgi:hypothetical protein
VGPGPHNGQIILGDKGFAGRDFEAFITECLGAVLVRPDRRDEAPRFGSLGRPRKGIASVFDALKGRLTLEHHGGRTPEGVFARFAARLFALVAAIWHNWHTSSPRKRSLTGYDHRPSSRTQSSRRSPLLSRSTAVYLRRDSFWRR